jgi:pyridoxamine 5'-phosphate oxidase
VLVSGAAKAVLQRGLHPPRPPHWGGLRLVPERFEFWQGRKSRLHDRLRYTLQADGSWLRERLAP